MIITAEQATQKLRAVKAIAEQIQLGLEKRREKERKNKVIAILKVIEKSIEDAISKQQNFIWHEIYSVPYSVLSYHEGFDPDTCKEVDNAQRIMDDIEKTLTGLGYTVKAVNERYSFNVQISWKE